jgi:hypothetical protein
MGYDFSVNEQLTLETQHVGRERQPVVIIDGYLRDPESMVRYAASETGFQSSPALYPGITAPGPDAYAESMVGRVVPMIGDIFRVKVDTAYLAHCYFGIVTFPAEQLHYRQRLPHVDDYDPGQIAFLHYLCDGSQGGTALYRHRTTGYESLDKKQFQHMQSLISQEIARNPLPAEYPSAKNRLFEQTAYVEAKFNRLVAYRSQLLHSMMIGPNTKLHPDPHIGRLTANTFLRFELA